VNGCDDIVSSTIIYRKAKEYGATVIDAYTSPLPSVYVTGPGDQRPEERLGFPTVTVATQKLPTAFDKSMEDACKFSEVVFVLTHSSSLKHIYLDAAVEMVAGKRPRMSLSMMVITTGNLMAYQVLACVLNKKDRADHRGFFIDGIGGKCEKPLPWPVSFIKGFLVKLYLKRLLG
jgi:hypothetical protein